MSTQPNLVDSIRVLSSCGGDADTPTDDVTLDTSTELTFGGKIHVAPNGEGDDDDDLPVLGAEKNDSSPWDTFARAAHLVIKDTGLASRVDAYTKIHAGRVHLPTQAFIRSPTTTEATASAIHVAAGENLTPEALEIDTAAFSALMYTISPPEREGKYCPSIGYFDQTRAHTLEDAHIRFTFGGGDTIPGIVALDDMIVLVPRMEIVGTDASGQPNVMILNEGLVTAARAESRVPVDEDDVPEFALRGETDAAVRALLPKFTSHHVTAGTLIAFTYTCPFVVMVAREDQEFVRWRVCAYSLDKPRRKVGDNDDDEDTINRPQDPMQNCLTGVVRQYRYGLLYPLAAGSCSPDGHDFVHADPHPYFCGTPGADEGLNLSPARTDNVSFASTVDANSPLYRMFIPAHLQTKPLTAKMVKVIETGWELARLRVRHGEIIVASAHLKLLHGDDAGITTYRLAELERMYNVQAALADKFKSLTTTALQKKISLAEEVWLPDAKNAADIKIRLLQDISGIKARIDACQEKINGNTDGHSKRTLRQLEVCTRKHPLVSESPTEAKVKKLLTSIATLEGYIEGDLSGGSSKKKKRPRKTVDAQANQTYPDADTHTPPPALIDDARKLTAAYEKYGMWYTKVRKEVMTSESIPMRKKIKALLRDVATRITAMRDIVESLTGPKLDTSFDVAPLEWAMSRIECWPDHPMAVAAMAASHRLDKKMPIQCECGNEDFISTAAAKSINVSSRCLVCEAEKIMAPLNAMYKKVLYAVSHGMVTDGPRSVIEVDADDVHYAKLIAECTTEEERAQMQEDIDTQRLIDASHRVANYVEEVGTGMTDAHCALDNIQAKPATKQNTVPNDWKRLIATTNNWSRLMSHVDVTELEDLNSDDEDDEEYNEEIPDAPACDECGGLVIEGVCMDCDDGEDTAPKRSRHKAREPSPDVDTSGFKAEIIARISSLEERIVSLLEARPQSMSVPDQLDDVAQRMDSGPAKSNLQSLAKSTRGYTPEGTHYGAYVATHRTTDPHSGRSAFDTRYGHLLGGDRNYFSSKDAAKQYLLESCDINADDDIPSCLFVAPVALVRDPATKRTSDDDDDDLNATAKKSRKTN